MRPAARLLRITAVLAAIATGFWLLNLFFRPDQLVLIGWLTSLLQIVSVIFTIVIVIDGFRLWRASELKVVRAVGAAFSQGVESSYQLSLTSGFPWVTTVAVIDGLPESFELRQPAWSVDMDKHAVLHHEFRVLPHKRGDFSITPAWLRATSAWRFWQRIQRAGETTEVKVYPNFSGFGGGLNLGLEHQIQLVGVHLMQRRGEGIDFRQLKEFVYGDSPGKVDWKASSRMGKLIAREYQDQRDQNIFFMLDCGHRMRSIENGYSYFDHAVNALLVTAWVALRQGDSVGLVSFAGEARWIAPVRGIGGMKSLLNQIYNLQSSTTTSDYLQLANQFVEKQPKRSLVILITNLHADDQLDILTTVELLQKKHIVMLITIEEPFIRELDSWVDQSDGDARYYATRVAFAHEKEQMLLRLRAAGVVAASTAVNELSKTLTREYLALKRAGRI